MDNLIVTSFGRVLRRLRTERGLSQEDLGLESGVARNHISKLELGLKQPTITTIFKVSAALKLTPGRLISLVDRERKIELTIGQSPRSTGV